MTEPLHVPAIGYDEKDYRQTIGDITTALLRSYRENRDLRDRIAELEAMVREMIELGREIDDDIQQQAYDRAAHTMTLKHGPHGEPIACVDQNGTLTDDPAEFEKTLREENEARLRDGYAPDDSYMRQLREEFREYVYKAGVGT